MLWAALLHVTMEEEKELFDEFPGADAGKWLASRMAEL